MTSAPDTALTKIDFYILPSAEPSARLDFACKLTEKAWRLGHRVYLHCSDAAQRQDLDERLWRFKGESFVPHSNTEDQPDGTIVMGLSEAPASHQDLLINLDLKVPEFFKRFARVAEVVVEDPAVRLAARESFRFYREHGYPLQDHTHQAYSRPGSCRLISAELTGDCGVKPVIRCTKASLLVGQPTAQIDARQLPGRALQVAGQGLVAKGQGQVGQVTADHGG